MKMIMRFLKDYKKECVLAPLFKMCSFIKMYSPYSI